MKIKILALATCLLITTGLFSACSQAINQGSLPATTPDSDVANTAIEDKQGSTSFKGVIVEVGGNYFLQKVGQGSEGIDSYSVSLQDYVGRLVTVTGQYSGDTLFVSEIVVED